MKKLIMGIVILLVVMITINMFLDMQSFGRDHPNVGYKSCLDCHKMHGSKKPKLRK